MGFVDKNRMAPKGVVDICLLDIIGEASEQHPITQEQIRDRLKNDYEIKIDRKSVRRHLANLVEGIGAIRYTEKHRTVRGEDESILTDFWLKRDFDGLELRALIYTVIFAKHIPVGQKRKLVEKLESLASEDFRKSMDNYILEDANTEMDFNQLFLSMEIIAEALEERKKVKFGYTHYVVG